MDIGPAPTKDGAQTIGYCALTSPGPTVQNQQLVAELVGAVLVGPRLQRIQHVSLNWTLQYFRLGSDTP